MSILRNILTAIRGHATKAGEDLVDLQAIPILEQQERDVRKQTAEIEAELLNQQGDLHGVERDIALLKSKIEEHIGYGKEAKKKKKADLVTDISRQILVFEEELAQKESVKAQILSVVEEMKVTVEENKRAHEELKTQIDTIKRTDKLQKAQAAVDSSLSSSASNLQQASELAKRTLEKQQKVKDRQSAKKALDKEANDTSLEGKLEKAGITSTPSQEDKLKAIEDRF